MLERYEERLTGNTPQTASFVVMEQDENDTPLPICISGVRIRTITVGEELEVDKKGQVHPILTE